jgi:hypothetical protein
MAAPPEVTLSHLDGRYVLVSLLEITQHDTAPLTIEDQNKKLSDPVNGLLTLVSVFGITTLDVHATD